MVMAITKTKGNYRVIESIIRNIIKYHPKCRVIESIIHNFSSYTCKLSSEEEYALSFSLDQHIPYKFNKNKSKLNGL